MKDTLLGVPVMGQLQMSVCTRTTWDVMRTFLESQRITTGVRSRTFGGHPYKKSGAVDPRRVPFATSRHDSVAGN